MSAPEQKASSEAAPDTASFPGAAPPDAGVLSQTGRLLCATPKLLEPGAPAEYWLVNAVEIIGSDTSCSVHIRSNEIAAIHARIKSAANQWTIQPCIGGPGIWVNNVEISEDAKLSGGDEVRFGPVVFSFSVLDVAPSEIAVVPDAPPERATPTARLAQTLQLELSPDGELVDVSSGAVIRPKLSDAAAAKPAQNMPGGGAQTPPARAASPPKSADGATMQKSLALLNEELPRIIQLLVTQAKKGNVDAACACLIYASRLGGRK